MDNWRKKAKCLKDGVGLHFFHPKGKTGSFSQEEKDAGSQPKDTISVQDERKVYCFDCPVLEPCREYTILNIADGFSAGMNEVEIREARKALGLGKIHAMP